MDPFMGSGTTARMAYSLGRDYIGFEIDPTFHKLCEEITAEEVERYDLQEAVKLDSFFS